MEDKFEIRLSLFEGPFDLLLFFIERDELDIHDIPIAKITNDFLDYIHQLDHLNLEVASEFILVAAKLMRIKAKMLLPRPQLDEEGNEIDPRDELVKHLLEYKRYKEVVTQMAEMEKLRLEKEKRGNLFSEIKKLSESVNVEAELQNLDLYKLLKVYQNVLNRYEIEKKRPIHTVVQYPYTIQDQKIYILGKLKGKKKVSFMDIIQMMPSKIAVIYNFLAILELLQLQSIHIQVGIGFNNFWVDYVEQVQAA
ncbi:MAG: segregation/condensation protein A [Bacteroidetes bacterium]|nr:segregation/condensation protein A [Bacteroidota bacterium]MDA1119016.1 segregation/condensation protein A [Bacteroidota bacterium]